MRLPPSHRLCVLFALVLLFFSGLCFANDHNEMLFQRKLYSRPDPKLFERFLKESDCKSDTSKADKLRKQILKDTYRGKKELGKKLKDFLDKLDPKMLEDLYYGRANIDDFIKQLEEQKRDFQMDLERKKGSKDIVVSTEDNLYRDIETGRVKRRKQQCCTLYSSQRDRLILRMCTFGKQTGVPVCVEVDLLKNNEFSSELLNKHKDGKKGFHCKKKGARGALDCSIDRQGYDAKKEYKGFKPKKDSDCENREQLFKDLKKLKIDNFKGTYEFFEKRPNYLQRVR